jgi:hypothetical protein
MKKFLSRTLEFIFGTDSDLEAARRGTYLGILPLIGGLALAKAIQGGVKAWQDKKSADSTNKANAANSKNQYESDKALELNREDSRLASSEAIIRALSGGSRSIDPAAAQKILTQRRLVARQGIPTKVNSNFGSNLLGTGADIAGTLIGAKLKGMGDPADSMSAGQPTTLRDSVSTYNPFSIIPTQFGAPTEFEKKR